MSQRPIVAGTVGRPHGLDGSFHVQGPRPELLPAGARVTVDGRELEIVRRAGTPERPILRLEGCQDRDGAVALRGQALEARIDAPGLGDDEWWAEELEGCRVVDGEQPVGTVRALLSLPSCEALEVERDGGGELLVPLVGDAIRAVDPDARRIDVSLKFLEPGAGP